MWCICWCARIYLYHKDDAVSVIPINETVRSKDWNAFCSEIGQWLGLSKLVMVYDVIMYWWEESNVRKREGRCIALAWLLSFRPYAYFAVQFTTVMLNRELNITIKDFAVLPRRDAAISIVAYENSAFICCKHLKCHDRCQIVGSVRATVSTLLKHWAPSQYKDRLIYVWWFPC